MMTSQASVIQENQHYGTIDDPHLRSSHKTSIVNKTISQRDLKIMKEKIAESKRQSCSFEAEQECLLLGILARHGMRFVLLKPRKMNVSSASSLEAFFIRVQSIIIGTDFFRLDDLIADEM